MRKSMIAVGWIVLVFAVLPFIDSAQASISSHLWANPKQRDYYDLFYGYVTVAYDRNSAAKLIVTITNPSYRSDAYYRVKVKMDWAPENVTSTEYKIKRGEAQVFELTVSIPSDVSNMYLHSYTIYSEYRFAPGDPWLLDDIRTYGSFAVYSPAQSEARSFRQELDVYPPLSQAQFPFLTSAKALELMLNASILESLGDQAYQTGNFESARNYYKNALENTKKAYAFHTSYLSNLETAMLGLMNAGQNYLSFQGIAFVIASIGFLLMGIGVVVYLVRRSKHPLVQAS